MPTARLSASSTPPAPLLRVHRRQSVLGPRPFSAEEDWVHRPFGSAVRLSHGPELRVQTGSDGEGHPWALMGLVVETERAAPDPAAQMEAATGAELPDRYASCAGHWVLVSGGQVYLDASGLLGCFFGWETDDRVWASSSPALLVQALGLEGDRALDPRQLYHEVGISWYAPPRSKIDRIRRLLPRPLMPAIDPARDYDEVLDALELYLAQGQTGRQFQWSVLYAPLLILAVVIGVQWSALGVAIGFTAATAILTVPELAYCLRTSHLSWADLARILWRPTTTSVMAALAAFAFDPGWLRSPELLVGLAVDLVVFCTAYALLWDGLQGGRQALADVLRLAARLRRAS